MSPPPSSIMDPSVTNSTQSRTKSPIVCAISGQVPNDPVASLKSGHVFEKKLIERALKTTHNVCPETGQPLLPGELISLKSHGKVIKQVEEEPLNGSVDGALKLIEEQWNAIVLELHQTKISLLETKKELTAALYRVEKADKLVAIVDKEKEDLTRKLEDEQRKVQQLEKLVAERKNHTESEVIVLPDSDPPQDVAELSDKSVPLEPTKPEKQPEGDGKKPDDDNKLVGSRNSPDIQIHPPTHPEQPRHKTLPEHILEQAKILNTALHTNRRSRELPEEFSSAAQVMSFSKLGEVQVENDGVAITSIALGAEDCAYVGTSNGNIWTLDTKSLQKDGACISAVNGGCVNRVRWDSEGGRLLSGGWDGYVRVWDSKREVGCVRGDGVVVDFALHPVSNLVLVMMQDGQFVWRDLGLGGAGVCERSSSARLCSGGMHPDGLVFAMGGENGMIEVWDVRIMERVLSFGTQGTGAVRSVELSGKGYYMGSAGGGSAQLYDLRKKSICGNVAVFGGGECYGLEFDEPHGEYGCAVGLSGATMFCGRRKAKVLATLAHEKEDLNAEFSGLRLGYAWGENAKWNLLGDASGVVWKFGGGVA